MLKALRLEAHAGRSGEKEFRPRDDASEGLIDSSLTCRKVMREVKQHGY